MTGSHQVAAQVQQVRDGGVDGDEPLRLNDGLAAPHSPLPDPSRLVRQLGPVVRVSTLLEQHVDDCTVLVDRPPQIPLPASDPDEDLVHEDGVAIAVVRAPQSMRVPGPELVAPEAYRLVGDQDASPGKDILRLKR